MTTQAEEIWAILAEISRKQKELIIQQAELVNEQKETERRFQETERLFQETERLFQESDRRLQETERILTESSRKTDARISQLSREIGNLGGKWGRFVENMVAPACETLFVSRGIPVHRVSQRVKQKLEHKTLEVDVLVSNENHVLAVEVKSTLGVDDIREFIQDLAEFKQFFPEYKNKQLYGAVAGIELEENADKYAYKQGLFVLAQAGEAIKILNGDNFQPKVW